jgi:hypothetical protein
VIADVHRGRSRARRARSRRVSDFAKRAARRRAPFTRATTPIRPQQQRPVVAVALAGCGSSLASAPASPRTVAGPASAAVRPSRVAVARPRSAIDRLAIVARRRYFEEVTGAAVQKPPRRVAADPVLLRALRSGDLADLRAEVRLQDAAPHAHITRVRVVRGSRVLADAGIASVLALRRRRCTTRTGGSWGRCSSRSRT